MREIYACAAALGGAFIRAAGKMALTYPRGAALEPAHHAPLATIVIHGDLATSYRIAMGIALRQLAA